MVFIRSKLVKGHTYYYLVKNTREGNNIKQEIIEYFGKEIPDKYLKDWRKKK